MDKHLTSKSKFLSLVLRHKPETIGLNLDENGWVNIDTLLKAAEGSGKSLSRNELLQIVQENNKKRFSISDDGKRIRAVQGHSIEVNLELLPTVPPALLFHGTVSEYLPAIREVGLQRMNRQYVHLSSDEETARLVAIRRGRPIILRINAAVMSEEGFIFFLSENGVWLTERVPPVYIEFPDEGNADG